MQIRSIQTQRVRANEYALERLVDSTINDFHEHEILVVTSKIISLCEGTVVPAGQIDRGTLVEREADYFLPADMNPYGFHISIKKNTLIASAGIDESNGDGNYILWPKDIQGTANRLREYLCARFSLHEIGIIVTDSHVLPLRWGTVGTCLAHSGFLALNNYIGKPDLFGRNLKVTYSNVSEGIAAAAVVCMGEGAESTPFAIASDIHFVQFQDRNPSEKELQDLEISIEEDIFAPILNAVDWEKGNSGK